MKISVKTQLNFVEYQFHIDEAKDLDALHKAAVLGNPPKWCNECRGTERFKLDSNKDKEGNTYVNVVCGSCGAKAKLGQYKVGGFFWHKFEKYQPKGQTVDQQPIATGKYEDGAVINTDEPPLQDECPF